MRQLSFVLVIWLLSWHCAVQASDKAGIYLSSKFDLNIASLQQFAPEADIQAIHSDDELSYLIAWPDLSIRLGARKEWVDRDVQIEGIYNWVGLFDLDASELVSFRRRIRNTEDVVGCVIEPAFLADARAQQVLLAIARHYHGFIFTHQSFYNHDGIKLVGQRVDPVHLIGEGESVELVSE
ncbi:hypothetical protein [Thaumasiovibrio subtropicus]|uniref:hypothetical protein n=1 Tax=Thaumasiovibrio subtropicus TaxID=1891207 RepID=UPI000B34C59C|nr:hypothetical protein [Thaumasiovibrio subtropicus]